MNTELIKLLGWIESIKSEYYQFYVYYNGIIAVDLADGSCFLAKDYSHVCLKEITEYDLRRITDLYGALQDILTSPEEHTVSELIEIYNELARFSD